MGNLQRMMNVIRKCTATQVDLSYTFSSSTVSGATSVFGRGLPSPHVGVVWACLVGK